MVLEDRMFPNVLEDDKNKSDEIDVTGGTIRALVRFVRDRVSET